MKIRKSDIYCRFPILLLLVSSVVVLAQRDNEPKEVRGYKVEHAKVEAKKSKNSNSETKPDDDPLLIRLGEAKLVSASPLGVTFDLPVIIAPVKQQGQVDQLVFEDMLVNETSVSIEDYLHPFALPTKDSLTLDPPLRVFVSTPQAVLTTLDDLWNSKEVWPVTGRIYVCGHFKKFIFKFKRAVPVEVKSSINNPLR